MNQNSPLWKPSPEQIKQSNITAFESLIESRHGLAFDGYAELYDWSVREKETFWSDLWDFCEVKGEKASGY